MRLEDRLGRIMTRQHALFEEIQRARADVAIFRNGLTVKLSSAENQELYLRRHYQQALDEHDPKAELLRELPEREHERAAEIRTAMAELDAVLDRLKERMDAVEDAMDKVRELQPVLIGRVVAARSAGLSREVFDVLNDALTYVELALEDGGDDADGGNLVGARP